MALATDWVRDVDTECIPVQKCDGRTTNQRAKKLTPSCDHAPAANQPAGVPGSRPGPAQAPSPARAARSQLGPKSAVREMSGAVPILERERVQSTEYRALSNAMAAAASSSAATVAPSSSELLLSSSASAASCCGQEVANAVPIALRKLIVLTVTVVTALILAGD